jgi:tRNA(Arg) A34 adenosine deaminase TadA
MIKRLFFDEVYKQALKSDMNFNHGSIVVYRGKIIGKGYNTYINSNCYDKVSLHAEVSAINDALKKISAEELKKCELIVIRVNSTGECLNSKPCCNCAKYINKFCIKRVFHS